VEKLIKRAPYTTIDYIKICSTKTLNNVEEIKSQSVIALAVKVGTTRLIDNHVFGDKLNV
jgi:pantoate--beta-alanine ligase